MRRTGVRGKGPATEPVSEAGASKPEAVTTRVLLGVKASNDPDIREGPVSWLGLASERLHSSPSGSTLSWV